MEREIEASQVIAAMRRVVDRVTRMRDQLNRLDAGMGDGDTGITAYKAARGLHEFLGQNPTADDLGTLLFDAGKAVNNAAPSTLGTLTATALMRAGREVKGRSGLDTRELARMLLAANAAIQERGHARPGDKTIVDALHPAAVAFSLAIDQGQDETAAASAMLEAARRGRDLARGLRSKIGRGAWVGDRTEDCLDPGTVLLVSILEAILDVKSEDA